MQMLNSHQTDLVEELETVTHLKALDRAYPTDSIGHTCRT